MTRASGSRACIAVGLSLAAALLSISALARAAQPAERIYVNGRVWTGSEAQPWAQALAVRGERLLAVGSDADVRRLRGPRTEVVDLRGAFVAPGFNDAHLHFLVIPQIELEDGLTLAELQRRVADFAREHPQAAWITGRGWGYTSFPERVPRRQHLDAIVPDRPVWLVQRDGHMALANSKALALAGVTRATPDPEHGVIERDAQGEPTGELKESAMTLVARLLPAPSAEERSAALLKLLERAASCGLTSVQNASFDPDDLEAFERAQREGRLKLRVSFSPVFEAQTVASTLAQARALRKRFPAGGPIEVTSVKGLLDGTVDARTAALFEPYVGGGRGLPFWKQYELDRAVARFDREGFQVRLHAIGDQAIRMALDAFERAARANGTTGRRHRVEHVEVPHPDDLPRFKALGVVASTQALFANPDSTTLDNYAVLLGRERSARANAFRRFDEAGAVQAFGSDWPVFSMEVLRGVYCAAARRTAEGTPREGWFPEQRISVEAALRHFTRDAAWAEFAEARKGTLEPGRLADFVVLSEDVTLPPLERVLQARVLRTVMGGRETWRLRAAPEVNTGATLERGAPAVAVSPVPGPAPR